MHTFVRKAMSGDFEGIVHNWQNLADFFIPFDRQYHCCKPDCVKRYTKFLKKQMRSEKSAVFVAEAGGKFVGHIMVSKKKLPSIFVIDKEAYIDELMVKEGYRRKGVGTALLKVAEKWAKKKGLKYMSLTSHAKNAPSTIAYLKYGFKKNTIKMYKPVR